MSIYGIFFGFFLLISGLYCASETALLRLSKRDIALLQNHYPNVAKIITKLLETPQKIFIAILIATHLSGFTACIIATYVGIRLLNLIGIANHFVQIVVISFSVSLVLVFCVSIFSKSLAIKNKLAVLVSTFWLLKMSYYIFYPFIMGLHTFVFILGKLLHLPTLNSLKFVNQDSILNIFEDENSVHLNASEQAMLNSIFEVSETLVREIMTPRMDIVTLDISLPVTKAIQSITACGFSRIPVFEQQKDNIVGILYAKDLLGITDKSLPIRRFIRDVVFVPETKNCVELLHQMKKSKFHMAVVVDEYGGISGVISMEDILEEIIGEVQDEYDTDKKPEFVQLSEGHYLVSASINIATLSQHLGCVFPDKEDFDTLGGFVLSYLGRFPEKRDTFTYQRFLFKIRDITKRRILSIEISTHQACPPQ